MFYIKKNNKINDFLLLKDLETFVIPYSKTNKNKINIVIDGIEVVAPHAGKDNVLIVHTFNDMSGSIPIFDWRFDSRKNINYIIIHNNPKKMFLSKTETLPKMGVNNKKIYEDLEKNRKIFGASIAKIYVLYIMELCLEY